MLYHFCSKDGFAITSGNCIPLYFSKGKMLIRIWDFKRKVSRNRIESNTSGKKRQPRKKESEKSVEFKLFLIRFLCTPVLPALHR